METTRRRLATEVEVEAGLVRLDDDGDALEVLLRCIDDASPLLDDDSESERAGETQTHTHTQTHTRLGQS